jgi:hypothetical protein
MNKKLLFNVFCFLLLTVCPTTANALSASQYASSSRLGKGRWVKIAIPDDGIYQLTYTELKSMGFNDPLSVRIYGFGGYPINETLNGSQFDDLEQVPCKHFDNKLCFYACGPVEFSLIDTSTTPRFTRTFNPYSTMGYYFITSDDETQLKEVTTTTYYITGNNLRNTSLNYEYYEHDLISVSQSGKDMLGEEMPNNTITLPYSLSNICPDSAVVVNPCVATKNDSVSTIWAQVNGEDADFTIGNRNIYSSSSEYVYYNSSAPSAIFKPQNGIMPDNGTLNLSITSTGKAAWSRFDYYMLTYYHHNTLTNAPFAQRRMFFDNVSSADIIAFENLRPSAQVWNVTKAKTPVNYTLSQKDDVTGFTPLYTTEYAQFIAFDPSEQLKSIAGFEVVDNQDIHGLPTPDMIIVTCDELIPQAERIAQMHRDNDNMTVHVLDQQKIFNEFSSGTPDAMAIRLMCKMFYDRDPNKFRNLLMFGAGTQDNRQIRGKRDCTILTYESPTSNDENNSYVSDDFFGMLEDNSGKNPAAEFLLLGVGRIPCASLQEAKSDVDKLLNYVNNPNYGPWRNNALYIADYYAKEHNLHAVQAEGISNIITDELGTGLMKNKVFITQFPKDPVTGYALDARKSMKALLESGQYFMTYVGHANPNNLSKTDMLWTNYESLNITNQHLPIVTTACCDVARFDGSQRGLIESFFHNPNGGAIAVLAATRSAYANGNDALNQAFVRALFCYNTKGYMSTLGEAYMLAKQSFGRTTSYNKMMFSLLGDPAMKVNYPKQLFKITKINNKTVGDASIASGALQKITIEAKVYNPNSTTVNTSFNGDATLFIYDYLKKELTENNRDVYFPRKLLTQVNGRVVNGVFNVTTVIPRYILRPGQSGLVSVYAHRDNSDEMVNGYFDKLTLNAYNESGYYTIHDDTPPTIDAIYFNDEELFEHSLQVNPSSTLYIKATDDVAFNNQILAIGNGMELKIDGGKTTISDVRYHASMSNDSKTLTVKIPLELEPGTHSLHYTVYDAAGNATTKTINFSVGGPQQVTLSVEEEPAIDFATFNVETNLSTTPLLTINVLDFQGNIIWHTTTSEFPLKWNLTGLTGKTMPAGIYTFYGKYNDGTIYGGTNTGTLIIGKKNNIQ